MFAPGSPSTLLQRYLDRFGGDRLEGENFTNSIPPKSPGNTPQISKGTSKRSHVSILDFALDQHKDLALQLLDILTDWLSFLSLLPSADPCSDEVRAVFI